MPKEDQNIKIKLLPKTGLDGNTFPNQPYETSDLPVALLAELENIDAILKTQISILSNRFNIDFISQILELLSLKNKLYPNSILFQENLESLITQEELNKDGYVQLMIYMIATKDFLKPPYSIERVLEITDRYYDPKYSQFREILQQTYNEAKAEQLYEGTFDEFVDQETGESPQFLTSFNLQLQNSPARILKLESEVVSRQDNPYLHTVLRLIREVRASMYSSTKIEESFYHQFKDCEDQVIKVEHEEFFERMKKVFVNFGSISRIFSHILAYMDGHRMSAELNLILAESIYYGLIALERSQPDNQSFIQSMSIESFLEFLDQLTTTNIGSKPRFIQELIQVESQPLWLNFMGVLQMHDLVEIARRMNLTYPEIDFLKGEAEQLDVTITGKLADEISTEELAYTRPSVVQSRITSSNQRDTQNQQPRTIVTSLPNTHPQDLDNWSSTKRNKILPVESTSSFVRNIIGTLQLPTQLPNSTDLSELRIEKINEETKVELHSWLTTNLEYPNVDLVTLKEPISFSHQASWYPSSEIFLTKLLTNDPNLQISENPLLLPKTKLIILSQIIQFITTFAPSILRLYNTRSLGENALTQAHINQLIEVFQISLNDPEATIDRIREGVTSLCQSNAIIDNLVNEVFISVLVQRNISNYNPSTMISYLIEMGSLIAHNSLDLIPPNPLSNIQNLANTQLENGDTPQQIIEKIYQQIYNVRHYFERPTQETTHTGNLIVNIQRDFSNLFDGLFKTQEGNEANTQIRMLYKLLVSNLGVSWTELLNYIFSNQEVQSYISNPTNKQRFDNNINNLIYIMGPFLGKVDLIESDQLETMLRQNLAINNSNELSWYIKIFFEGHMHCLQRALDCHQEFQNPESGSIGESMKATVLVGEANMLNKLATNKGLELILNSSEGSPIDIPSLWDICNFNSHQFTAYPRTKLYPSIIQSELNRIKNGILAKLPKDQISITDPLAIKQIKIILYSVRQAAIGSNDYVAQEYFAKSNGVANQEPKQAPDYSQYIPEAPKEESQEFTNLVSAINQLSKGFDPTRIESLNNSAYLSYYLFNLPKEDVAKQYIVLQFAHKKRELLMLFLEELITLVRSQHQLFTFILPSDLLELSELAKQKKPENEAFSNPRIMYLMDNIVKNSKFNKFEYGADWVIDNLAEIRESVLVPMVVEILEQDHIAQVNSQLQKVKLRGIKEKVISQIRQQQSSNPRNLGIHLQTIQNSIAEAETALYQFKSFINQIAKVLHSSFNSMEIVKAIGYMGFKIVELIENTRNQNDKMILKYITAQIFGVSGSEAVPSTQPFNENPNLPIQLIEVIFGVFEQYIDIHDRLTDPKTSEFTTLFDCFGIMQNCSIFDNILISAKLYPEKTIEALQATTSQDVKNTFGRINYYPKGGKQSTDIFKHITTNGVFPEDYPVSDSENIQNFNQFINSCKLRIAQSHDLTNKLKLAALIIYLTDIDKSLHILPHQINVYNIAKPQNEQIPVRAIQNYQRETKKVLEEIIKKNKNEVDFDLVVRNIQSIQQIYQDFCQQIQHISQQNQSNLQYSIPLLKTYVQSYD